MGETLMTTRVLILNVHSSRNAGDAALAHMTLKLLEEQFSPLQATLSMDDPASHSGAGTAVGSLINWLKSTLPGEKPKWKKWNLVRLVPATLIPVLSFRLFRRAVYVFTPQALRNLVDAYLRADLVVSEAGGFLYHSGSGLTLLVAFYSLALALLVGKPLYIFPQSIGPFHKKWQCTFARWVLNRARIVMVREPISLEQIEACGVKPDMCRLVPDLAFGFESAAVDDAEGWLVRQGIDLSQDRPLLGFTVINWGAQNRQFNLQGRYESAIASTARFFIENYGGKVVFIPQVWGPLPSQDDRTPARRIAAHLDSLASRVLVIEEPLAPDLLKAVYGRMDLFIGTRMHSNIFALSEGVPVIAIGYQHKTKGIARMLGLEEWVIDIQQVDEVGLNNLLGDLCDKKETLRRKIQAGMPAIIAGSQQAGRLVATDFASLKTDKKHE